MRTIKVSVRTNKVGSECTNEFEVEDDATEAEIEEEARQVMWDMAEWNWEETHD